MKDQEILDTLQALDGRLDRLFEFVKLNTSAQKVEKVTGFVMGRRKDGQPCLWMYGPDHLEFKLFTLWKEQVADCPFYEIVVSACEEQDKRWQAAQAPTRAEAIDMGYFFPVEFDAVFKTDGTINEKSGKLSYRFDHWFDPDTEEKIEMSKPRPVIDYTAVRKQAAQAGSDSEFATVAHPLYQNAIESAERLERGLVYVRGENPTDYRAALIALDMFCDMLAAGVGGAKAGQMGKSVYAATLNSLIDFEAKV